MKSAIDVARNGRVHQAWILPARGKLPLTIGSLAPHDPLSCNGSRVTIGTGGGGIENKLVPARASD